MNKRKIPNIITYFRILCALTLIFIPFHTMEFFVLYIIGGVSDCIDGFLARRWNVTSQIGAILDSIADLFFVVIVMIKVLMFASIPKIIFVMALIISVIRISSLIVSYVHYHKIYMLHTYANKATGLALFFYPIGLQLKNIDIFMYLLVLIASIASLEELWIHLTNTTPNRNCKGILFRGK